MIKRLLLIAAPVTEIAAAAAMALRLTCAGALCVALLAACSDSATGSPAAGDTGEPEGDTGNEFAMSDDGTYRYITSNGLPDHETGEFPNSGNPHAISEQLHEYRILLEPVLADQSTPIGLSPFGVAVNGIPLDPGAAEFWNRDRSSGWQYEALSGAIDLGLDRHNAHVQPGGAYHYHGLPSALVNSQNDDAHSRLIGYAGDGFPIFALYGYHAGDPDSGVRELSSSYRLRSGARDNGPGGAFDGTFIEDFEFVPGLGHLDQCNGRFTETPDAPLGTYAYFLTRDFPVIPRCWRGEPDPSFIRGPGAGPGGGPPPGGP